MKCDIMLLWNGAEQTTAPFLLRKYGIHPHTTNAILGVSHIIRNPQCVLLFWWHPCSLGVTILGGF